MMVLSVLESAEAPGSKFHEKALGYPADLRDIPKAGYPGRNQDVLLWGYPALNQDIAMKAGYPTLGRDIPNYFKISHYFQNIPLFPKYSKGLSSLKNWQKPEKRVKFLEGLRQLLMVQPAGKSISKVHPIF